MKIKIKDISKLFLIIISIVLLRIFSDYIYKEYIVTLYGYTGFIIEQTFNKTILSIIILIIFTVSMIEIILKRISFSRTVVVVFFYVLIIPFTTMIRYYPFSYKFILLNTFYWILFLITYRLMPIINQNKVMRSEISKIFLIFIYLLAILTVIYISIRYTGFRIIFNIFNVYGMRSESKSYNLPILIKYIYNASKTINIIYLVYFMKNDNKKMVLLTIFVQLLNFSISGLKLIAFSTVISTITYFILNKRKVENILIMIGYFVSGVSFIGIIEAKWLGSYKVIDLICRRVMLVPNLINYNYFDFFTNNSPDFFRQTVLSKFGFESIYKIPIPNLIGLKYYGKINMAASDGMIADALTNFGVFGVLIMPIALVILLKIFDGVTKNLDVRLYIIPALTISYVLFTSFISTALISHGLFAVVIVFYLMPKDMEKVL